MTLTTKTIVTAGSGGALVGLSTGLLMSGHYAPWQVFNAAIGCFLLFVANRLGLDLTEKTQDAPPAR
ncbi:MAG: hypothetical protein EBZ48_07320 [Proteobacteria bacterium]|nr:hypothetical protein [Pseudomonadota bacterium]